MAETESRTGKSLYRSRAFLTIVIVAAALVILWVASELAIPPIAESYARGRIEGKYPEAEEVSVSISAFPALELAFKKYDTLEVGVSGVTLQGVRFDQILLKSSDWPLGSFTATIGHGEIVRFFSLKNSWLIDPELSTDEDGITVSGKVDIGPRVVSLTTRGKLEAVDGNILFFRPDDIQVPEIINKEEAISEARRVMDDTPVFIVREDLPYTIRTVASGRGKLVIRGSVDMEEALRVKL
jgi:hypothetical protein